MCCCCSGLPLKNINKLISPFVKIVIKEKATLLWKSKKHITNNIPKYEIRKKNPSPQTRELILSLKLQGMFQAKYVFIILYILSDPEGIIYCYYYLLSIVALTCYQHCKYHRIYDQHNPHRLSIHHFINLFHCFFV